MSLNDILNEKVCYNKHILIDNKPITNRLFRINNIECLNDLLKPDLSFKTNQDLNWLNTMEYNQLITSIPNQWKKLVSDKRGKKETFKPISDLQVKIGTKHKEIIHIKCKEFYWHQLNKTYETPTAVNKWEELYYYVHFDWRHIFSLPYETTSETSLQSLQYQILNRFFPCKETWYEWNCGTDEKCPFCNCVVTLEHFFFHCSLVKPFWRLFFDWWKRVSECNFNLGALDIIFGIMNENRSD